MLLYLDAPGLGLSAREGKLIVKQNGHTSYLPRGRLQCVIMAARGYVTADALAWLAREHVALLVVWEGEFLTVANATAGRLARGELKARIRQMECVLDEDRRLAAAKWLVIAKIRTLGLDRKMAERSIGKAARARSSD
jgi:CRISPR/Cas system-associated endonuclease Cas1